MSKTFLRRLGLSLLAATTLCLITIGVGAAADGGPLVIGAQNLGTPGGSITQLRAITNGPAFYATNEWGNGISAIAYPPYGIGVYGIHQATTGAAAGVRGETFSGASAGVIGVDSAGTGGYGVVADGYNGFYGVARGSTGAAVFGNADAAVSTAWGVAGSANPPAFAGYFSGNVQVTGTLSAATKNFKIDDPLDPAHKYLVHSSVESSEQVNVYSGNSTTDAKGFATVQMPRWFQALNRDFRYQLTVVGRSFAQAIVWKEIADNQFTIETNQPKVKVSWQVTGVRHDPYANAHPLTVEQSKPTAEQGKYLNPELYGRPKSRAIGYRKPPKPMK